MSQGVGFKCCHPKTAWPPTYLYNLETNNIHLKKLPATLNDSLEIMKNSSFIKEVLGEKLVEKYYLIKKS